MIIKTYQKYIFTSYTSTLLQITLIFTSLILILNIFEEINFFKELDVNFFLPVLLTFLNTPSVLYDVFPFIFLISTQFFFIKITEKNELIIFKNFGLNNFQILKFISLITLIFGLLVVVIFYNLSSKFKFLYFDIKNNFSKDNKYLAVITENGLWIKDEVNNTINIINADKIDGHYLENVSIVQFDTSFELIQNINSNKVDISSYKWKIKNARISKDNVEINSTEDIEFETHFDLKKINSLFSNLYSLTLWELEKLKKDYKSLGYSTTDINIHKQKIFSYPIYLMIMTIFSGIIMLNIKYNKPKIFNLVFGILLSVLIYYINFFSNLLGQNGKIPVILSIWLPLFILVLLSSIGLIRINEK